MDNVFFKYLFNINLILRFILIFYEINSGNIGLFKCKIFKVYIIRYTYYKHLKILINII